MFFSVFDAIGGTLDLDHVRMMDEPIEDGRSDRIIIEDLAPILERAVGGEDHGALFVTVGHDLEEKVGAILVEGHVKFWGVNFSGLVHKNQAATA